MKTSTKLKILDTAVIIGAIIAIFEYIGLSTPLWHSISYYSQNNSWLFLAILGFLISLPFVWIWHIFSHRIPK